ncbi:sialidase family protein [Paraflavitalea sp. CAU 1676]|uniref:sialidase family protein n=1 Tax=Paraflavitalea sp. CAU 1676 TaxID=3032598 RepID=UPI0023DCA5D0|nr:sialidase family protein [Paraflavitalea sp. CAU 1676]MDF2191349.1 sialidase family protein [Paraflavitalea sp. CAU 1676]
MTYRKYFIFVIVLTLVLACHQQKSKDIQVVIGRGGMPAMSKATDGLQVVYGIGDSIMYVPYNFHNQVSSPSLIAVLPNLAASHSRGPQIATTQSGTTVIACNGAGNIFSYLKDNTGQWSTAIRINDMDTTAKEGLVALDGNGDRLFAVWLDLRSKHNQIFGASSTDGGKTWSKNILVYASPDTTVCECCKPSVVVKDNTISIMFRNWLDGNRDLYVVQSSDGGNSFGNAQKLGTGNWALNGCPMDGGALAVQDDLTVQTVWRRQGKIYSCQASKPETEVGEGKGCTMTLVNNQPVYAWVENGQVVCLLPKSGKKVLGKGRYPVLKSVDASSFACLWESEKQIQLQVVTL